MAHHQRGASEALKAPHSLSLKVLRLSKPTLAIQYPLPKQSTNDETVIDRRAGLSGSISREDDDFFLCPILALPSSFGTVHVGETLLATICVNNELSAEDEKSPTISKVHVTSEIQTPSADDNSELAEISRTEGDAADENGVLPKGTTQQRIISFPLRAEGIHVLAITVSYLESHRPEDEKETGLIERARTFRKLYQFTAQQLLSVRTKTRALPFGKNPYVVEAQVENLGDDTIVLETVSMYTKKGFGSRGMNAWDGEEDDSDGHQKRPILRPRNVLQVAFLVEPRSVTTTTSEDSNGQSADESRSKDGRVTLGQMWIEWRGPMGTRGSLNTGWLTGKRL